jgi:maleate cis-trans isomerase
MAFTAPRARLGIVLSASNRMVEPYFRAYAPASLGLHMTRMHMAAGNVGGPEEIKAEAVAAARLAGAARPDVIDLQMTGQVMAMGAEAEAALIADIETATGGIPAYTATQALVEALAALGATRILAVTPLEVAANADERGYLEAAGIAFAGEVGLGLAGGPATAETPPAAWVEAATTHDTAEAQAVLLSGSNTTMVEAIQPIEAALGKPAVTSVQAALWAGLRRLKDKLGPFDAAPELGRLMTTL